MKGGVFMASSILSEDENVHSSITDICSPNTTYLDLMIMYAATKRKGKPKSFKLDYVNDMKWKGDNMKENNIKTDNVENKSLVKTLYISKNKKSYTKPVILKLSKLLSEYKQKQYSNIY